MADKKKVNVYRINYELSNSSWSAHIAAFSKQEAVAELKQSIPGKIQRIDSINEHCELDMVSTPIKRELETPIRKKVKRLKKEVDILKKAKDLRTVKK